jgi:protease-4
MRMRRVILLVGLALLAALIFLPRGGPKIAPGSVLVVDVSGPYVESAAPSFFGRLLGAERRPFVSLLSELKKAQLDERIDAVVLRIRRVQMGWGMAQEVRDAIRELHDTGKPTLAYLETGGLGANLEYYLASAAGELVLSPGSSSPITGLGMEFLFLGGLWDKLGAGLDVIGSGEYKSAADTLGGTEMTEAHREMATSILDSTFEQFVNGIALGRGLEPTTIRYLVDQPPVKPDELRDAGLVDGVDVFDLAVAKFAPGPIVEAGDYAAVDPESLGWEPVARHALVYGSGMVVVGNGTSTAGGSQVMSSDTVSQALLDAAEDPEISAIIFRIDSPGGSPLAADIIWRAAERARANGKPFIASVSNMAASGGYYVAAGADKIVAPAGSLIGSIGVFVMRPVIAGLLEKLDIGVESMTRGSFADVLLTSRPLSDDGRQRLEREILSIYDLFVARVSAGRGLTAEEVDAVGRGRVWTGIQAREHGLVDELGGLRKAVRLANEAAGLAEDADVVLVTYPEPRSLTDQVAEALQQGVLRAAAPLRLSGLAGRLEALLAALPTGSPVLVPPLVVEIR